MSGDEREDEHMESAFVRPGEAEDGENTPKTVLKPRNPGEALKIATTVLRRRDRNLKAAAERAARVAKVRREKQKFEMGKIQIMRAEKFCKNARTMEYAHRRLKHVKKHTKKWPKPAATNPGKVIAVLRNGRPRPNPEAKKCIRWMNLKIKNSLTIIRNIPENIKKLKIIEPFAYWGPVSFKTVFNLIHKKGKFKAPGVGAEKITLSDNVIIEDHLGSLGCLCTEDVAHILHTAGENFDKVRDRLWSFEMDETRYASHMMRDDTWTFGDKGKEMDKLIAKMLGN